MLINQKGILETLFYRNQINSYVTIRGTQQWGNETTLPTNSISNLLNWSVPEGYRYFSVAETYPFLLFEFLQDIPYISYYSFQKSNEQSSPTQWILEGANNEEDQWELLDYRKDAVFSESIPKEMFQMKTTKYKYYKFTQYNNSCGREYYHNTFSVRKIDF